MKKAFTALFFFVLVCSAFALSSITNSAFFTVDTVAPTLSLSSLIGGDTGSVGDTHDLINYETLGWCLCQHLGQNLIITGKVTV